MPLPLIAIVQALLAGGSLVPHVSGGMIVTGTSGYVSGTFLSTAAINSLLATAGTGLGLSATYLAGAAAKVIGGAGYFGTTIGATGIKGALMSAGLISSTPMWVPVVVGGASLTCGYFSYRLIKLRRKVTNTPDGQEAMFTDSEALLIEHLIKRASNGQNASE